jgi:hypothetical protein
VVPSIVCTHTPPLARSGRADRRGWTLANMNTKIEQIEISLNEKELQEHSDLIE